MQPLDRITVLDLTHMLSGPYGTMMLADLGARTIKVEPPGAARARASCSAGDPTTRCDGMGAYFLTLNRSKESVGIDLKTRRRAARVFYDLVRHADVVFDNFGAGVAAAPAASTTRRWRAINPRIITCSVTGFGETGPDTQRPAFDQVVQGMGGGMSITGDPTARRCAAASRSATSAAASSARWACSPRCRRASAPAAASTSTSRCSTPRSRCSPTWRRCT